jgi:hypothetical protein
MVGKTRKRYHWGNGVKALISMFLQSTSGWFLSAYLRQNRCYAQKINDMKWEMERRINTTTLQASINE